MVRLRSVRLTPAILLLCIAGICQSDTSASDVADHRALKSLARAQDATQVADAQREQNGSSKNSDETYRTATANDESSPPGVESGWPPWPWHHKNDTAKNDTKPDDDGGGGHHWPWPWPHPHHNDTKNGTDPDDNGGGGDDPDDDHDKTKNKTDTSCASHSSCKECAESSWGCHWCAHDEACHPIGSVHGCLSGVNCYSEDRCTRKVPEAITGYDWTDVGTVPLVVILSAAGLLILCATCCLGVACCMRGTYEDYATLAVANAGDSVWVGEEAMDNADHRKRTVIFHDATAGNDADEYANEGQGGDAPQEEGTEYHRLLLEEGGASNNGADEESLNTRITMARSQVTSKSSNTKCMFNACSICYAVTVFCVSALALTGIVYSPRRPEVNVCADAVAWKSIVDGMTSFEMQASFQILMSVENPNRFDVVIDMASGNFNYKGAQVGTFNVPPTKIESMAITDLLVSVTFTPDKWEALSLTAEYYKGTLSFLVDMQAAIEIPALAGYTYNFKVDGYKVLANDPSLQDRHLCFCPDKKAGKNKDIPAITGGATAAAASDLFPIADH